MKNKILFLFLLGMVNLQAQVKKTTTPAKKTSTTTTIAKKPVAVEGIFATIATNKGNIVLVLEYKKTPVTVANFIALAEGTQTFVSNEKLKGKPFYDGLKFHRVIKDFMIQGGDPLGTGSGDPGYRFKDEFTDLKHDKGGILSMANSGPKTNGSQFFITHKETSWLNGKHTVFGHVIQGMDVVNLIVQDDVITKVTITRKGTAAKQFNAAKVFAEYYNNQEADAKKQALIDAENKAKQEAAAAEAKKAYNQKYAPVMNAKVAYFAKQRLTATKTASGLEYVLTKGTGSKPTDGTTVYVHYSGYLADGSLFDSSYEQINKDYGRFDHNRASQNGYQPFPYEIGRKDGLIPGFLEGINTMSTGDKALFFIPANIGYGANGYPGLIPPNTDLYFEIELMDSMPSAK